MQNKTKQIHLHYNEIHIWKAGTVITLSREQKDFYLSLLSDEEHDRLEHFRFNKNRNEFLISHALVRLALSRYEPIHPDDWKFVYNDFGRPEIANPTKQNLRFNLSHTTGMAVCAIALENDIGVDIENYLRTDLDSDLQRNILSDMEQLALKQQNSNDETRRLLTYWTLKEAYLKARGDGLSIEPNKISYNLTTSEPTVHFDSSLNDFDHDWQFSSFELSNQHIAAIAVRSQQRPQLILQSKFQ